MGTGFEISKVHTSPVSLFSAVSLWIQLKLLATVTVSSLPVARPPLAYVHELTFSTLGCGVSSQQWKSDYSRYYAICPSSVFTSLLLDF